jgi:diphthine-ammonia ligase
MPNPPVDAAVLWTGGKDCSLALHAARASGLAVRGLVTFTPREPRFLAHPLPVLLTQARALGLPHRCCVIEEPFREGYERALRRLRDEGLRVLVTGDIAEVAGHPNWVRELAEPLGLRVDTPLWGRSREELLARLLELRFRVVISCVDTRRLPATWVGRELAAAAIAELHELQRSQGVDACGENGEYHTLVLEAPGFRAPVELGAFRVEERAPFAHLVPGELRLRPGAGSSRLAALSPD